MVMIMMMMADDDDDDNDDFSQTSVDLIISIMQELLRVNELNGQHFNKGIPNKPTNKEQNYLIVCLPVYLSLCLFVCFFLCLFVCFLFSSHDSLEWRAQLENYKVSSILQGRHEADVTFVQMHPHFNVSRHGNDIALVRLGTPTGGKQVTPICLPSPSMAVVTDGSGCYVTGWGDTKGKTGDSNTRKYTKMTPRRQKSRQRKSCFRGRNETVGLKPVYATRHLNNSNKKEPTKINFGSDHLQPSVSTGGR